MNETRLRWLMFSLAFLMLYLFTVGVTNGQSRGRIKTASPEYWTDYKGIKFVFMDRLGWMEEVEVERKANAEYNPEITVMFDINLGKTGDYRIAETPEEADMLVDNKLIFRFKSSAIKQHRRTSYD